MWLSVLCCWLTVPIISFLPVCDHILLSVHAWSFILEDATQLLLLFPYPMYLMVTFLNKFISLLNYCTILFHPSMPLYLVEVNLKLYFPTMFLHFKICGIHCSATSCSRGGYYVIWTCHPDGITPPGPWFPQISFYFLVILQSQFILPLLHFYLLSPGLCIILCWTVAISSFLGRVVVVLVRFICVRSVIRGFQIIIVGASSPGWIYIILVVYS